VCRPADDNLLLRMAIRPHPTATSPFVNYLDPTAPQSRLY
jgi:hypothetical protein